MSKNTDLVYIWARDIYNILKNAEYYFNQAGISGNSTAQKGLREMATAKGYAQAVATTVKPEEEEEDSDNEHL